MCPWAPGAGGVAPGAIEEGCHLRAWFTSYLVVSCGEQDIELD